MNAVVGWAAWGLWQSTQVAWRLLFRSPASPRSCELFATGGGCDPVFANSLYTFKSAGCVLVPE